MDLLGDHTLRVVAYGAAVLGATAGALGSFAVLRRQSLLGDALSHAALPGIALAFLITSSRQPLVIMIGAGLAGWLATLAVTQVVFGMPRLVFPEPGDYRIQAISGGSRLLEKRLILREAAEADLPEGSPPEEEEETTGPGGGEGTNWAIIAGIIVVIVAVAIVGMMMLMRKRKPPKEEEQYPEDMGAPYTGEGMYAPGPPGGPPGGGAVPGRGEAPALEEAPGGALAWDEPAGLLPPKGGE